MTHLGHRLSALIDGELAAGERERVLVHVSKCASCQQEIAALRTLKRRMNALGEAAADADLTRRLMGLREPGRSGARIPDGTPWPAATGAWPPGRIGRPEPRVGRYVAVGTFAVLLAGLGTAAFIAGGDSQAQAPEPAVTPSVDVYMVQHDIMNGWVPATQPPPGSDQSPSSR